MLLRGSLGSCSLEIAMIHIVDSICAFAVKPSTEAGNDAKLVQKLLSAVGVAAKVEEKLLDAVTGLR